MRARVAKADHESRAPSLIIIPELTKGRAIGIIKFSKIEKPVVGIHPLTHTFSIFLS